MMNQQSEQFEPNEGVVYQAPKTLIPNVLAQLGLEESHKHIDSSFTSLLKDLQAEHWQTRVAALGTLNYQGRQVPIELLSHALHDADASVRASAVRLLGMLDDRIAIPELETALHDPNWHVRETVVFTLGQLVSPPIDLLLQAQEDEDSAVRDAATSIVRDIQMEDFTIQPLPSEVLQVQPHSGSSKTHNYKNSMLRYLQNIGDRIVPKQHTQVYKPFPRIENAEGKGKQRPVMRMLEVVIAAMVILGLVGSWSALTHGVHTSMQGHTGASLTTKGKFLYHQAQMTPAASWTSNSKYVYIYDKQDDSVIHFIDIATKRVVATIANPDLVAQKTTGKLATLTPDSLSVCTVDNTGSSLHIQVQSVLTNKILFDASYPKIAHTSTGIISQWSNDGTRIALSSDNSIITIANVTTVQPLVILTGATTPAKTLEWSQDDRELLATTADGIMQLWNTTTGQRSYVATVRSDTISPYLQALSPDGKYVAIIPDEQSIHILDTATGKVILNFHDVMSPPGAYYQWIDRTHIISNNEIGTSNMEHIQIWDVVTGHVTLDIPIVSDGEFATSSNYTYIVTQTTNPTTFEVWDAKTGRKVAIHSSSSTYPGGSSPNEKYFITTGGGSDNKIDMWSPTTGKTVTTYYASDNSVVNAEWSPDGKYILSLSTNGRSNPVGATLDLWQAPG